MIMREDEKNMEWIFALNIKWHNIPEEIRKGSTEHDIR
jgi:hypothetical protein